ncbi:hypothetical protein PPERSA_02772 [Pseudocohnilembus persalinus]|uniref:Uncharacterized protein n=1 Tax=Pseudocohnilembus persalinus TaxID=266149 RepID=A0A0V0Q8S2_PSEPJ|nr:hypothetical protein PPERSA_02772 [Pseudocohnilembus persalinus]|eukprot:KRW98624.1 hypothetical protein PPERSA_02772 [Pseudocohnilembus persalinus]
MNQQQQIKINCQIHINEPIMFINLSSLKQSQQNQFLCNQCISELKEIQDQNLKYLNIFEILNKNLWEISFNSLNFNENQHEQLQKLIKQQENPQFLDQQLQKHYLQIENYFNDLINQVTEELNKVKKQKIIEHQYLFQQYHNNAQRVNFKELLNLNNLKEHLQEIFSLNNNINFHPCKKKLQNQNNQQNIQNIFEIQNTDNIQNIKNTQSLFNIQNTDNSQNIQNTNNSQNSQNTQNMDNFQIIQNKDNIQDIQYIQNPQNSTKNTQKTQNNQKKQFQSLSQLLKNLLNSLPQAQTQLNSLISEKKVLKSKLKTYQQNLAQKLPPLFKQSLKNIANNNLKFFPSSYENNHNFNQITIPPDFSHFFFDKKTIFDWKQIYSETLEKNTIYHLKLKIDLQQQNSTIIFLGIGDIQDKNNDLFNYNYLKITGEEPPEAKFQLISKGVKPVEFMHKNTIFNLKFCYKLKLLQFYDEEQKCFIEEKQLDISEIQNPVFFMQVKQQSDSYVKITILSTQEIEC